MFINKKELPEDLPILREFGDEAHDVEGSYTGNLKSPYGQMRNFSLFWFICLMISNIAWWMNYPDSNAGPCVRPQLIFSPATSAITYQRKTLLRNIDNNTYTGLPRPELDSAWRDLLSPMTIRITRDELTALGETSLALSDGSGFLAEMTVFHELHCIKRIRRHLHFDYYYANLTHDELARESRHMDHCLEYWREAAMCRGDVSLTTFVWHEGKPFSKVRNDNECVDWERLRSWTEGRAVRLTNLSIIEPPVNVYAGRSP